MTQQRIEEFSTDTLTASTKDDAWRLVLAAARAAEAAARCGRRTLYALDETGELVRSSTSGQATIVWDPERGWLQADRGVEASALVDLYLPVCSATAARPITLGHLGESLDGFIATHTGDSRWVTGHANMVHMHRLRALCDAVIVGAGTVAADDPRLTTRLVDGPNPLRVVLDPGRRLPSNHRVFADDGAPTLIVCAGDLVSQAETRCGNAEVLAVSGDSESLDLQELLHALHSRGCARIFVEGGGVTISTFLQANLLDRLHLAIAPLLIGDGRAAIRLPAPALLGECHRPEYRVFRMGGDVLFDCNLRSRAQASNGPDAENSVSRII
jgi:diaminohydroxyphosphoribosylaminopyrimidine deaminase / 5-amino-6-(5-phosphoribosylamino)uracil reductase